MNERIKNFILFKVWMTDSELEDAAPAFVIMGVLVVVGALLYVVFNR